MYIEIDFNSDEARYNRQNRLSPPEFAPGQDPSFGGDDDLFSDCAKDCYQDAIA